jgi:DNA-binding MarR family transcriptional regulator
MHMHPIPPSSCVCTTLRRATRALTRAYDDALADHGITIQQFAILRHAKEAMEGAPVPLASLAHRLVMDRTSLYRALPPLERAGWVTLASPSPRQRTAFVTPAGDALLARAEPDWQAMQARVLATMPPAEWQAMKITADRLATTLSQDFAA